MAKHSNRFRKKCRLVVTPKTPPAKEASSVGAKLGEQLRSSTNALNDDQRQRLRAAGMALIYGSGNAGAQVHSNSR